MDGGSSVDEVTSVEAVSVEVEWIVDDTSCVHSRAAFDLAVANGCVTTLDSGGTTFVARLDPH